MEDETAYLFVENDPLNSIDYLGLFKLNTTWGEWSIGVAGYRVWGFDFGCSFKKESKDCCDDNGRFVKDGQKQQA